MRKQAVYHLLLRKNKTMLFKSKHFILSCLFFCLISSKIKAQQPIFFDHLNIEKGLSQNAVLAVTQDQDGFIWLGTRHGLNRYDGYRFKVYLTNPADSTSLKNDYINTLFRDHAGSLWIGTDFGLHKYNSKKESFEFIGDQSKHKASPDQKVNCIYEDKSGNLWIGTISGLKLLPAKNRKAYTHSVFAGKNQLPSGNIRSVYQDHLGAIWVGTSNGLTRITLHQGREQLEHFKNNMLSGAVSDNFITSMIEDKEKNLWIGTQNGGINRYNRPANNFTAFKHTSDPKSIISNVIRNMILDQSGNLWIGSLEGVSIMNPGTLTAVSYQNAPENKKKPESELCLQFVQR